MTQSALGVAKNLKAGDVFRESSTLRVVDEYNANLRHLVAEDVQTREIFHIVPEGTSKIEVVQKAVPRKPQRQDYAVGDVLTTRELRAVMWKRGTMIARLPGYRVNLASVLCEDGRWHPVSNEYAANFPKVINGSFDFDALDVRSSFELLYLPE